MLNTLNEMAFNGALQYESEAGSQAARPELPPFGKRVVIPVEKGGGYKPMPFNDIRAATQLLYSVLESRIQRGALPAVDYGNLNFPLSAVAISRLTEGKDQIFLPRIQALAMFYQQLSQMAIRQYKDFGMNVELGQEGYTQQYPYKDLDGRYSITYRFFTTSSEQRIADLSIAAGSRDFLSEDTIRRDVLKLQDPDGEYMKKRAEMAERVDPAIALYRYACSLIDQEEYIEARMIAQTAVAMIRQRQLGGQVEAAPQEQKSPQVGPKDLIPLLTAGGGGRQMPKGEPQPQVQEPAPTGG